MYWMWGHWSYQQQMQLPNNPNHQLIDWSTTESPCNKRKKWQAVRFHKNRKWQQKLKNPTRQESTSEAKGIQVKIFDVTTGKFLNTQTFHYQGKSTHSTDKGIKNQTSNLKVDTSNTPTPSNFSNSTLSHPQTNKIGNLHPPTPSTYTLGPLTQTQTNLLLKHPQPTVYVTQPRNDSPITQTQNP